MSKEINIGDKVYSTVKRKVCTVKDKWFPFCCELEDDEGNEFFSTEDWIEKLRSFEEIGNELSASLGVEWGKVQFFDNRMEFENERKTILCIFTNGGFALEVDATMYSDERFTPTQLAAISAACQEIAANYEAEHRKENQ